MSSNERPVTTKGAVARPALSLVTRHVSLLTRHWRVVYLLAVACLGAVSLQAASRSLFFPHLISGMGFETRLVLTNPSSAPASVVVTARGDGGGLLTGAYQGIREFHRQESK